MALRRRHRGEALAFDLERRRPKSATRRTGQAPVRCGRRRPCRRARRSRRIGARSRHRAPGRRPKASRCAAPAVAAASGGPLRREEIAELAPDHHRDQALAADACDVVGADKFAVLQHGDPIADRKYLFQAMRNEDHRDAAVAQAAQPIEQQRHLAPGDHGGRLVEHQQLDPVHHALARSRPSAGRRPTAFRRWRDGSSETPSRCSNSLRFAPHPRMVDSAEPVAPLMADEDVLRDGQLRKQHEFLVDDVDAVLFRLARRRPAGRRAVERRSRPGPARRRRQRS